MISCQQIMLSRFVGQSLSFLIYTTWIKISTSFVVHTWYVFSMCLLSLEELKDVKNRLASL